MGKPTYAPSMFALLPLPCSRQEHVYTYVCTTVGQYFNNSAAIAVLLLTIMLSQHVIVLSQYYRTSKRQSCSYLIQVRKEQLGRCNRPYSHKLLTINNYVNCPSNFAFARSICLFHPPIFLMRIRSIEKTV